MSVHHPFDPDHRPCQQDAGKDNPAGGYPDGHEQQGVLQKGVGYGNVIIQNIGVLGGESAALHVVDDNPGAIGQAEGIGNNPQESGLLGDA